MEHFFNEVNLGVLRQVTDGPPWLCQLGQNGALEAVLSEA